MDFKGKLKDLISGVFSVSVSKKVGTCEERGFRLDRMSAVWNSHQHTRWELPSVC